jgi:SOS-response transcriptional repressor LexA
MTQTAKERLTARQQEVLDFIVANMSLYSPTVRQIAWAIGAKSPHAATVHLDALEKKGFIRRVKGKPRNIEVVS